MQKQREQGYNKPVLLPGLFMAVIFSAVFALPAWRLAATYLPMRVTWSHDLSYVCADSNLISWQVRDFLELNFIRFRSLAYSNYPSIARDLSAEYDLNNAVLTLKVSCTEDAVDNLSAEYDSVFQNFISECVKADTVVPGELFEKDSAENRLNKWLNDNRSKLVALQQRQVDLLMDINTCEQELLSVQTRNLVQYFPLKSTTDKQSGSIKKTDDIQDLLEKLKVRQQELDKQAAYCKDNLLLEQIDYQRDDIFRERQQLLAELDLALEQSDDPIEVPEKDNMPADISRARENYDFARYKLDLLKVELADLNSEINFVEQFLPEMDGAGESVFPSFIDDRTGELSVWAGINKLKLSQKSADVKKTRTFSYLQNLAIGLSGFFGFMLGLVVFRLFSGSRSEVNSLQIEVPACACRDIVGNNHEEAQECLESESQTDVAGGDEDGDDCSRELSFDRFAGPVDEMEDNNWQSSRETTSTTADGEAEELDGFASWWVESYDKLAYRLSENRAAMSDGMIFSALDKSLLSPRFMINLAISLALKGEKVLVVSASQDGVLEKIFSDFSDDYSLKDSPAAGDQTNSCFIKPGFWDCLDNDLPFSAYVVPSPLENLKFLHSGMASGLEVVNNEINNNSDYAEECTDIDFDCILIYMPELLEGGVRELQKQAKLGPISKILSRFSNIVAVDFIFKPSARKRASISQELARIRCRLIDF